MKSFSHFSEDIASRRKMFKQRQVKQAADFKDRTTGAHQRAKADAKRKAAYKAQVRAEVEKEIENEREP
tara:strand:- start:362 stop:568 length:207 start_codon:yes stop_codon:yes gene_type:complete